MLAQVCHDYGESLASSPGPLSYARGPGDEAQFYWLIDGVRYIERSCMHAYVVYVYVC